MCKFYSAIVLRNGDLLHNENLTSHEDIIDLFGINDTQSNCDKFVRVEFTPEEENDYPDIEKYKLNIDEKTTPDWFEQHREYVTQRLKDFVSKRIITSDRKLLTGGLYVVKDCHIGKITSAMVIYLQNSSVETMRENSSVKTMRENSSVETMWENSSVETMRENSSVETMRGNSSVKTMRDNSSVETMRGNSSVESMWENSSVKSINSKNKLPR